MIRMMMYDNRSGDQRFKETMQDFVKTYAGNAAISNGTLPTTLDSLLSDLKPEGASFFTQNGERSGFLGFDLKEPPADSFDGLL
jgi:hypothetical protein